jgi:ribonucleoside-diphosphate reductase alpha chain
VFFQNANHSVRLDNEFMEQALRGEDQDGPWVAYRRTDGEWVDLPPARGILDEIAETAWACGDPGVQFTDTINDMHTCAREGMINASNPCSEFVFLDNTACNLASINLLKFWDGEVFDWFKLRQVVEVLIVSQDILVSLGEYPTDAIDKMTRATRPLGLGIANLGALLMTMGIAYDSDDGRQLAAAIMAFITGTAYGTSAGIAEELSTFDLYERNKPYMEQVISKHANAADKLVHRISLAHRDDSWAAFWGKVTDEVEGAWGRAVQFGEASGYRNAQVTVIAPTGTISFMMDCDTTGIEPLLAERYQKTLVGGGVLEVAPECYQDGLNYLRLTDPRGVFKVNDPVLATALGENTLSPEAHLLMVAAVQPFISGAVSKTINMPADSTVADVKGIIIQAWKEGVKCVAIYRDGSKGSQPMTVEESEHPIGEWGFSPPKTTTSVQEVAELYAADLEGGPKPNQITEILRKTKASGRVRESDTGWLGDTIDDAKAESMLLRIATDPKVVAAVRDMMQFKTEREIGEMLSTNIANKIAREPSRRKLDKTRAATTHKFDIGGHEGYLTVGTYKDGKVAEVFVSMAKEGTTISGLLGQWAMTFSIALQYGVPLDLLIDKHSYVRYEPSGFTSDPDVKQAHSITDYIVRWIKANMTGDPGKVPGPASPPPTSSSQPALVDSVTKDGNVCQYCGGNLTRQGTCYVCATCGEGTGCG